MDTPFATFHVKSGHSYRFRIVSPGFTLCPIQVSVENHTLTLIARLYLSGWTILLVQMIVPLVFKHNVKKLSLYPNKTLLLHKPS